MQRAYLLCIAILGSTVLTAQSPALLNDIYNFQTNGSISSAANYTLVGSTVFFTVNNGSTGIELWKTNGTAASTVLVKDIYPDQAINIAPDLMTEVNGVLLFRVTELLNGQELWRSDGIAAGTVAFDIKPGTGTSFSGAFTKLNNPLIFSANDFLYGTEQWSIGTTPFVTNFNWTGNVSTAWETPGNWAVIQYPLVFQQLLSRQGGQGILL